MPPSPLASSLELTLGTHSLVVEIRRSAQRRRTVSLSLVDHGRLRLLAPLRLSEKAIRAFLDRRQDWIEKRLRERRAPPEPLGPSARSSFVLWQGERLTWRIERRHGGIVACARLTEGLVVQLPHGLSAREEEAEVACALRLWERREMRRLFRERTAHWAPLVGARPRRVGASTARTRWGSCSARNDIRLNAVLLRLPPELLDYVIAHELCHIPHKNHGPGFWSLLTRVMPDCRERRRQLRQWEHLLGLHKARGQDESDL